MTFLNGGWWTGAKAMPAHQGRVGGSIAPYAIVVHTMDMAPGSFAALAHSWTTNGPQQVFGRWINTDCAHFAIGRTAADGVVQFVPVTRNANHADGNGGHFQDAAGAIGDPNRVSIGIELDCAGGVRNIDGQWRLVENGAPTGAPIPPLEVIPDPARPGRGWHMVTDYQLAILGTLLDELEASVLRSTPPGLVACSTEQPPSYGRFPPGSRVVGHVSLNAADRADPWPQVCDWIRARRP